MRPISIDEIVLSPHFWHDLYVTEFGVFLGALLVILIGYPLLRWMDAKRAKP